MTAVSISFRNCMKKTGKTISKANMAKLEANAARACNLLKAMANPTRLMVLCQIAEGEKSVGELAQAVGQSQSALSQHLTVLRLKHLVVARRAGQTVYYSLASDEAASVMETLYELFCRKPARRASLGLTARPV
jgi:ArsR family transcriptional regulator, virulence genes transcriptional regulator